MLRGLAMEGQFLGLAPDPDPASNHTKPIPSFHPLQCFYHHVDAGNKLTGSYEVISGGLLDVDVSVSSRARGAAFGNSGG